METVAIVTMGLLVIVFMILTLVFVYISLKKIEQVKNLKYEITSLAVANKILKENIDEMNKN